MKKFNILLLSCGILMILSACGLGSWEKQNDSEMSSEETSEKTEVTNNNGSQLSTVVFPETFESLSGMDEEELKDYLETNGNGNYDTINIVNGQVELSFDETQRAYWLNYLKEEAEKQEEILTAVSSKYNASCNETYDVITASYDTRLSFEQAFKYVGNTVVYCAMYQLFNGTEDYSLSLEVYNVDTGKLVAGGDLEVDDVSYDDTEWQESYALSADEAKNLTAASNDNSDKLNVKSSFADGISIIKIIQFAGGNDYQYIYLDEEGNVVIGLNESQRSTLTDNMNQYLEDIASQFSDLGDKYNITWSPDYSSIYYKFDEQLSKQDQTNYFIYTETICMLNQILSGNDGTYYIDINIYNSSTDELVSSGNTVDGISWNIGE